MILAFAEKNTSLFSFFAGKVREMLAEELETLQEAGKVRVLESWSSGLLWFRRNCDVVVHFFCHVNFYIGSPLSLELMEIRSVG